jgi:hypothetical protein
MMKERQVHSRRFGGPPVSEESERILRLLPELIRRDETFRVKLWQVLNAEFSSKADLAKVLEEIRKSREAADKRFEAVDKRFEALLAGLENLQAEHQRDREEHRKDMDGLIGMVNTVVGGFGRRAGRRLEDTIAGTFRIAFGIRDVDPSKLTCRRKIVDKTGQIGPAGRSYEIDMVVTNGETWIFEIKSVAEPEDIERFNDKAELAKSLLGLSSIRKGIITLDKSDEVRAMCDRLGIVLG